MIHPLAPKLDDLTEEELVNKINELYAKINRTRGNYQLYNQVSLMLETYKEEFNKRTLEREKELVEQMGGEDFYSDKIKIQ